MSLKVLVVDDAPIIRMMIGAVLTNCGCTVVGQACDGVEALEKYRELKPDMVTMDMTMPNRDGIGALKDILNFDPNAKVVMVTAVDQRDTLLQAIKLGAIDYIVKPFDEKQLKDVIQKVMGSKS